MKEIEGLAQEGFRLGGVAFLGEDLAEDEQRAASAFVLGHEAAADGQGLARERLRFIEMAALGEDAGEGVLKVERQQMFGPEDARGAGLAVKQYFFGLGGIALEEAVERKVVEAPHGGLAVGGAHALEAGEFFALEALGAGEIAAGGENVGEIAEGVDGLVVIGTEDALAHLQDLPGDFLGVGELFFLGEDFGVGFQRDDGFRGVRPEDVHAALPGVAAEGFGFVEFARAVHEEEGQVLLRGEGFRMLFAEGIAAEGDGAAEILFGLGQQTQFLVGGAEGNAEGGFDFRLAGERGIGVQMAGGALEDFLHGDFLFAGGRVRGGLVKEVGGEELVDGFGLAPGLGGGVAFAAGFARLPETDAGADQQRERDGDGGGDGESMTVEQAL